MQASLSQCIRLFEAGADYVRLAVPDKASIPALKKIRQDLHRAGFRQPLIADIHFNPDLALMAAPLVEKLRINPGNYYRAWDKGKSSWTADEVRQELEGLRDTLAPLIRTCKNYGTAIRIGTNSGSLSPRIVARFGNGPEAMAAATMEFLRVFEELDFTSTVISLKSSSPLLTVRAHQLMVRQMDAEGMAYPLHLGVTEAGEGMEGRARSALGISALLKSGLGDTIRVSLTEPPEAELAFARELLAQFEFATASDHDSARHNPADPGSAKAVLSSSADARPAPAVLYGSTDPRPAPAALQKGNSMGLVVTRPGRMPWEEGTYRLHTPGRPGAAEPETQVQEAEEPETQIQEAAVNVVMLDKLPGPSWLKALGSLTGPVLVADTDAGFDPELLPALHEAIVNANISTEILVKLRVLSPGASGEGSPTADGPAVKDGSPTAGSPTAGSPTGPLSDRLLAFLAARFGDLLTERIVGGFWLETDSPQTPGDAGLAAEWLLQAGGLKSRRTSYTACPTCARTAFDLPAVLSQLKEQLPDLAGLKIAVMGCIVNGPGEMGDAHFGLMGTGRHSLAIYRGGQLVKKGVATGDAAEELLGLLREDGWY